MKNSTIVVNWKDNGFGCTETCSYCNWKTSKFLPNGCASDELIEEFVSNASKDFITISGGGEPLFELDKNYDRLKRIADIIHSHGKMVRCITRNVELIDNVLPFIDKFSISIDNKSGPLLEKLDGITKRKYIEASIVLLPVDTQSIINMKGYFSKLRINLKLDKLILRENLNSFERINWDDKELYDNGRLMYVPRELCLGSEYLLENKVMTGYDMEHNSREILNVILPIINNKQAFFFGSALRVFLNSRIYSEFNDYDLIVIGKSINDIPQILDYEFKLESDPNRKPQYYSGKSKHKNAKKINIILVESELEAKFILNSGEFNIDKIYMFGDKVYNFDKLGQQFNFGDRIASRDVSIPLELWKDDINRKRSLTNHRVKLLRQNFILKEVK